MGFIWDIHLLPYSFLPLRSWLFFLPLVRITLPLSSSSLLPSTPLSNPTQARGRERQSPFIHTLSRPIPLGDLFPLSLF